jgi:hypothetical protein
MYVSLYQHPLFVMLILLNDGFSPRLSILHNINMAYLTAVLYDFPYSCKSICDPRSRIQSCTSSCYGPNHG